MGIDNNLAILDSGYFSEENIKDILIINDIKKLVDV
jgi:hypothetical protein